MNYLVGIPCLTGASHCKLAIESVAYRDNVSILIIDNGAEPEVKEMLKEYRNMRNFYIISNPENIYVNAAWSQILEYFLSKPEYDYLLIMNSDLALNVNWDKVLDLYFENYPQVIPIPIIRNDNVDTCEVELIIKHDEVFEGTPGVCIILNRKHAKIVFPLPTEILVWFGDDVIYGILRGLGYKTIVPHNLLSSHSQSSTVVKVAGISEIIEEDKRQWEKIKGCVDLRILEWENK